MKKLLLSIISILLINLIIAQERCDGNNRCGPEAPCCSQFGYCGSTWEYCGIGCVFEKSFLPQKCYHYKPPVPPVDPHYPEVKRCSANSQCPFDAPCCSQFGYCGNTADYCHNNCNPLGSYSPLSCGNHIPAPPIYPNVEPEYPPINEVLPEINHPNEWPHEDWNVQTCHPWKEHFNGEQANGFGGNFIYGGPVQWERNYLSLKMIRNYENKPAIGGWARTKKFYHYGKFSARIKSARVGGIVSAFNLISKDGDEIDFEWVGHRENSVQTNYYYKGILDYSKGQFYDNNSNLHYYYHTYTIYWTKHFIGFYLDQQLIRKVTRESTYNPATKTYHFPTSPVQVQFMLWDGGSASPGTSDWAGGYIDWNDPEILANNGSMDMKVDYFSYEC